MNIRNYVEALLAEDFHKYISKSTGYTTLSTIISLITYPPEKLPNEWSPKYYPIKSIGLIFVEKRSLFKERLGQFNYKNTQNY